MAKWTQEEIAKKRESLNFVIDACECAGKDIPKEYEFAKDALDTIEAQQQEAEQVSNALVELKDEAKKALDTFNKVCDENKQLRDMLKRAIEAATFFKSHYTGKVGEYLDYSNLITDANKLLKGDGENG